jgi:hypothetical protein
MGTVAERLRIEVLDSGGGELSKGKEQVVLVKGQKRCTGAAAVAVVVVAVTN